PRWEMAIFLERTTNRQRSREGKVHPSRVRQHVAQPLQRPRQHLPHSNGVRTRNHPTAATRQHADCQTAGTSKPATAFLFLSVASCERMLQRLDRVSPSRWSFQTLRSDAS